ncbi:hypothetical protein SAMD00019534_008400 [Acytostelium subglobosum LB1]|uniref:hypothetical protein n=1 Tax=Acytostelium subglobosum LB1 TaxID=1410327 RepID=UPI0006448C07|nr:hypothetical protein SAMD00019534_008400 [Acytostelium subglobosum LB1]GAM17665.1 hypothetical protein SAMD00019534_008400 [Acytostelium subglobosum LB1]|eukprot:XP_012758261.1 hypothetical protein SAMD00019534_008400 [Acytostelium subglobosum LB1]
MSHGRVKVLSDGQLFTELTAAGGKLVAVDFTATWCPPCRAIGPIFEQLSNQYTNVVFLKVDVDQCRSTAQQCGISAMPTFHFYIKSTKVDEFSGADPNRLKQCIERHQTNEVSTFATPGNVLGHGSAGSPAAAQQPAAARPAQPEKLQPNAKMLAELIEMGFPENRAIKALLTVKNQSAETAMEWIFANMENPQIDEPFVDQSGGGSTTTTTSSSDDAPEVHNALCDLCTKQIIGIRYKCKVCLNYDLCQACKDSGKHPADHEMSAHSKDIANYTLTPEEKAHQKKMLDEKILMLRKKKAEEEAKREIEREMSRRESGKLQQDSVEKWKEQQNKREADKIKKEKEDEARAKQRIRDKIAQDKMERAARAKSGPDASSPVVAPAVAAPVVVPVAAPTAVPDVVMIQIRMADGSTVRANFKPKDTLQDVHSYLSANGQSGAFRLSTTYPRKIFDSSELKTTTLLDAGLVPNGTLMVTK